MEEARRQRQGTADGESSFRSWYGGWSKQLGLNPDPDDPRHFYDYRAAHRAGARPNAEGHWPSEFKRPGHPNLVVRGIDTRTGLPAAQAPDVSANAAPQEPVNVQRASTRVLEQRRARQPELDLPSATIGTFIASMFPSRYGDPAIEQGLEAAARSGALGKTLIPGEPAHETYDRFGERRMVPERKPLMGEDVLGAAATAGTAVREYTYGKLLGGISSQIVKPVFGYLGRLESKLLPRQAAYLAELAGRSTAASRVSAAVSSAAQGAAEAAVFGAGREAAESGHPERGIGYAPYGAAFGAGLGAVTATRISTARALTSPGELGRAQFQAGERDPFRVLGLDAKSATVEQVDEAFKSRAARWHPDKNPDPEATGIFQMYSEARSRARDVLRAQDRATATPPPTTTTEGTPAQTAAAPVEPVVDPAAPAPPKESVSQRVRRTVADIIHPEGAGERRALERAANTDALTGVANQAAWQNAKPNIDADPNTEVVTIDMGNLKAVNDAGGHEAGNQAIVAAAEAIQRGVEEAGGSAERVFRTGGDEFVVAVPKGMGAKALAAAQAYYEPQAVDIKGQTYQTTLDGTVGSTHEEADLALRTAKQARKHGAAYRPLGAEAPRAPEVAAGRPAAKTPTAAPAPPPERKPVTPQVAALPGTTPLGMPAARPAPPAEGRPPAAPAVVNTFADLPHGTRFEFADSPGTVYLKDVGNFYRSMEGGRRFTANPTNAVRAVRMGAPPAAAEDVPPAAAPEQISGSHRVTADREGESIWQMQDLPEGTYLEPKINEHGLQVAVKPDGTYVYIRAAERLAAEEAPRELPTAAPGEPEAEPAAGLPPVGAERPAERVPERGGRGGEQVPPAAAGAAEREAAVQPGGIPGPSELGEAPAPGSAGDRAQRPDIGPRPGDGAGAQPGRVSGQQYRITDADQLGAGGVRDKAARNVAAIELLKQLEAAQRPATVEEQRQLVQFTGWGAMPQIFTGEGDWQALHDQLRAVLTDEEWRTAKASTPNAHYTSKPVIDAMWSALRRLGFTGGRALEPSAGVGHFVGLQPADLLGKFTAVELDKITGRLAAQLYPKSDVRVQGFEDSKLPDNFYDLAISNVPFGDYPVADPRYDKLKLSIHNYFFAKALDVVRPGGVVAFITSRYTMDERSSAFRTYLANRANLLGAIRLPNTAFEKTAGTKVTTDIIILQKRAEGEPAKHADAWMQLAPLEYGNQVNEYFLGNPRMVLGKHDTIRGQYRMHEYAVTPGAESLEESLERAIGLLPENVMSAAVRPIADARAPMHIDAPATVKDGGYTLHEGKVHQKRGASLVPASLPETRAAVVRSMIPVRDATRAVLHAQLTDAPESEIAAAQKTLADAYQRFVKKHGPINKSVKSKSGAERRPNLEAFSADPDAPLVAGIETVDSDTGAITKMPIFSERVIRLQPKITKVDAPVDGLLASLNEFGRVNIERIGELLGMTPDDAAAALAGRIYEDPELRGQWVTAEEYLSGNVRTKLLAAKAAAGVDAKYAHNVTALEGVQPVDVEPSEIDARLGSPWIPTDDIVKFIDDILGPSRTGNRAKVTHLPTEGAWAVNAPWDQTRGVMATKEWGHEEYGAIALIEDALNQRQPTIYDPPIAVDVRAKPNTDKTLAAREKLEKLKERFRTWLWEDEQRGTRLHRFYNDNYNNLQEMKFDGSHITLPGSNPQIKFRPHQKNVVYRIIAKGNTLLAHVVGGGKTYAMAAAGMEGRRIGLTKKPMYVVPNHLLNQFSKEFLQLYPAAKLLLATEEEFHAKNRRAFTAKIATGDWDGVIITHSSFGRIPVSRAFEQEFINTQLAQLDSLYQEARETGSRDLTKLIEKAKKRWEVKLKKLSAREKKDDVLSFEELGVDQLFVDEADLFKNLEAFTKMKNVGITSSQRAHDLYMKALHLDRVNPGRGLVFSTATPIANSIVEMFTMQRYLQPRALAERGIGHLDAWAPAFGENVTAMELKPEGGFRVHTRFAAFHNVPELTQMFRQVADVQTAEMLKLPVPKIRGGKPGVVSAPGSAELKSYQEQLVKRAEAIRSGRIDPEVDNMLKVTTDGRKAALDMRLIAPALTDNPHSKGNRAVENIYEIWKDSAAKRLTQLVFIDFSTPKYGEGFSVYEDIRDKLLAKGVPKDELAFIHDADSKPKQAVLFQKVRDGKVRILMGSTEKMGAGTNVQDKLVASHHMDAPWRPRDIEQRDGRIVRQGNKNEEVQIYRYVTEGSFDGYMWQTLETKAKFIDQIMKAEVGVRRIEDVDARHLTFAEVKAIATGDKTVLEKATIDAEVAKLSRLQRAWKDSQFNTGRELALAPERIAAVEGRIEKITKDVATLQDVKGDKFAITIGTRSYTDRGEAAPVLMNRIASAQVMAKEYGDVQIGEYAGFPLMVEVHRPGGAPPKVFIRGGEDYSTEIPLATTPTGALQATEYLTKRVRLDLEGAEGQLAELEKRQKQLGKLTQEPFEHAARLAELVARQEAINKKLQLNESEPDGAGDAGEDTEIPAEDSDEAFTTESEPVIEKIETDAGGAEKVKAAEDSRARGLRTTLESKLRAIGAEDLALAGMTNEELVTVALDHGVIDDVTAKDMLEQLGDWLKEKGAGLSTQELTDDEVQASLAKAAGELGGRVIADALPRGVGIVGGWLMPSRRLALRLMHDKRADLRAIGQKVYDIVRAGQATTLTLQRLVDKDRGRLVQRIQQVIQGLSKADVARLAALLDAHEEAPPADTPANITAAFRQMRDHYKQDLRDIGANERLTVSERSRQILDQAVAEWPVTAPHPDFDNEPVNRQNILAAARRANISTVPATADEWRALSIELKSLRRRVQEPVFMESPDLRRIYKMLRGEGRRNYLPHVFMGDWRVNAGEKSARFTDRLDAINYARQLLESGAFEGDILVQRDAFVPEASLFVSRRQWQRLKSEIERQIDAEGATVSKGLGAAGIRVQPRRRFFAHMQERKFNLQTFEKDFVELNRIYNNRLARKLAFDPFRKVALDIKDTLPLDGGWRDWAESYIADVQGVPHEFTEQLNRTIQLWTLGRLSPMTAQLWASRWQKAMSLFFLGYSVPTALVNLTQTAINTIPGFAKNGTYWVWRGVRELLSNSAESKAVLDHVGVDFQHPQYMLGDMLPRGIGVNVRKWFAPMWAFNTSESINKSIAALAKYAEQKAAGVSTQEALAAASEFVYNTQFDYSMADAPRIMRNPIGRAFLQFKLFSINELFFAEDIFRWGNTRQKAAFSFNLLLLGGLRLLALGTPLFLVNWLLGGAQIPGTQKRALPSVFHDDEGHKITPWEKLSLELGPTAGSRLVAAMKYGLLGAFNVNISQRLGFGGPEEFATSLVGRQLLSLKTALTAATASQRWKATKDLLPVILKRFLAWREAASEGRVRDKYGDVINPAPTGADLTRMALGFSSVAEAERSEELGRERGERARYAADRQGWMQRAADTLRESGPTAVLEIIRQARAAGVTMTFKEVRQYMERRDEPDIQGRIRGTPRALREELFSPEELQQYGGRRHGPPRPQPPARPRRPHR